MTNPDTLDLWHEQRRVGQLWRNTAGAIGFRYDPAWIAGGGFSASRSLPLAAGEFVPEAGIAHRFFANLLPEGAVRDHIVRDLKLPNTDFDLLRDDRYFLPQGEAPSSHILKFELADYRHLPAYETFTTRLAAATGLPVVDITLRSAGQTRYAQIARYDRLWDERGEVRRLHQEDFCQALGYGHERKYQEHGGPSFAQCYRLVQDASSEPAIDAQHLLRWQIFNVLAGNSDGHAKNLSLLHLPDDTTRLAPFYDLACTRAIERIDCHLAFGVGGERNPSVITPARWEVLARQCDARPQFLRNLVQETAAALQDRLAPVREEFEAHYGAYPALQRIEKMLTSSAGVPPSNSAAAAIKGRDKAPCLAHQPKKAHYYAGLRLV